ncbi:CoA transferase [Bradyrhizobium sp. 144]|uniref:CoA transferase n=1 Tax=Bradyrhizobium sp. 144 TaxID=2782620 RepID=UPI001FF94EF5|nr:CoA transferase [Bradyrhizobium sp. 144]
MFEADARGEMTRRRGINRFWPMFPAGIYETKKGWLGVTTLTPAQWRSFCDMLGLSELRDDSGLVLSADRLPYIDQIEREFLPKLKARTAQEWFVEGLQRKIPIVPVPEISDLLLDPEKSARGAIVPVFIGEEEA